MRITCRSLTILKKGNLVASADLELLDTGLILRGCRLFGDENGGFNVTLPTTQVNGRHYPVVSFSSEAIKRRFQEEALKAIWLFRRLEDVFDG